jgi:hypothetical protein
MLGEIEVATGKFEGAQWHEQFNLGGVYSSPSNDPRFYTKINKGVVITRKKHLAPPKSSFGVASVLGYRPHKILNDPVGSQSTHPACTADR